MEQSLAADCLITNPPYRLAEDFISHAIHLGCTKHAYLLRLSFLEGVGRHQRLFSKHPPARIHVFSHRLTIWRGDQQQTSTGTTAYAWFVWDKDWPVKSRLGLAADARPAARRTKRTRRRTSSRTRRYPARQSRRRYTLRPVPNRHGRTRQMLLTRQTIHRYILGQSVQHRTDNGHITASRVTAHETPRRMGLHRKAQTRRPTP